MQVTTLNASISNPRGICIDSDGTTIVSDSVSHRIWKLSPGGETTQFAGSGNAFFADGQGTTTHFHGPSGVAFDQQGNIIVADTNNHRIRKIAPDGTVNTLAGSGSASYLDAEGASAYFNSPTDVAVDDHNNVIVADQGNHRIRKIAPDGKVTTLAGSGSATHGDGLGAAAHFHTPSGVACYDGCVFVADTNTHRVREIDANGHVTTMAGSGGNGYADGRGAAASFQSPSAVTVDGDGCVIVAENGGHRLRKITPDGTVITLAGSGSGSFADGNGTLAHFRNPQGVAIDPDGRVLVADFSNSRIRCIDAKLAPPRSFALPPALPSAYEAQMRALLQDSTFADVTFDVSGEQITAHRAQLCARSEYFKAMFEGSFAEAGRRDSPIKIGDTTAGAFKELLSYLYTDSLSFTDEHMIDVMRKAKELQLERVFNHAVRHCHRSISPKNAVMWFIQADQYKLDELREMAFKYVARNFRRIRAEAKATLLPLQDSPTLMMEVMLEAL